MSRASRESLGRLPCIDEDHELTSCPFVIHSANVEPRQSKAKDGSGGKKKADDPERKRKQEQQREEMRKSKKLRQINNVFVCKWGRKKLVGATCYYPP